MKFVNKNAYIQVHNHCMNALHNVHSPNHVFSSHNTLSLTTIFVYSQHTLLFTIQTAIFGYSFCKAARCAFFLIARNILRVVAVNMVGDFVLLLGKVIVP